VAWSEIEVYGSNSGTTNYVLNDAQGSARTVMNNNGSSSSVIARHDYLPFGEEISSGLRGSGLGYGATDNNRQKYGMTERDDATGLDHTWWRKYENLSGRWTSPDPLSGGIGDPQSFNGYNYTGNDPVNFIDPSGLNPQEPPRRPTIDPATREPFAGGVPGIGATVTVPIGWDDPITRRGGGSGDGTEWVTVAVINRGDLNGGGGPQSPYDIRTIISEAKQKAARPLTPFEKARAACLAREIAKADAGRAQYVANFPKRIRRSAVFGGVRGVAMGAYAGANGGEFLEPLGGGIPGAIGGGVIGGIVGTAAGVIGSMLTEPAWRWNYDRSTYRPALNRTAIDCDAEARTAVSTTILTGGR
jgi:RHS repeat-associated protein